MSGRVAGALARGALALGTLIAMGAIFEVGLRLAGFEAIYDVYSKPSVLWRHDPLLGWHHEPLHQERYVGPRPWPVEFETRIKINSLGLRGPELAPRPPRGRRVLVLGDSVVAGFEVEAEETFAARLAPLLAGQLGAPVQTINGGVRGYGTDQSLLYYRERGRRLGAEVVVFVHSVNDFRNNMTLHRRRRPFGKGAFALEGTEEEIREGRARLVLRGTPVPRYSLCSQVVMTDAFEVQHSGGLLARALCGVETRLSDHSALFTLMTMRLRQNPALVHWLYGLAGSDGGGVPEPVDTSEAEGWHFGFVPSGEGGGALASLEFPRVFAAGVAHAEPRGEAEPQQREARFVLGARLLVELAREVEADGAQLVIVMNQLQRGRIETAPIEAAGARIVSIPFPAAAAAGRAWRWQNDGHFNELGHELAADALAPYVLEALVAR